MALRLETLAEVEVLAGEGLLEGLAPRGHRDELLRRVGGAWLGLGLGSGLGLG